MTSAELKSTQPVVWRIVHNALSRNHLAHAYLFAGDKSIDKTGAALLFAQSMVCEHPDADGFACQECPSCQRVASQSSADFKILHKEDLKRKTIVALQEDFASTALGANSTRIYIMEDFDRARADAANALLKFLEEPQPNIHAILTCTQKSNVLPTILSRCQTVSFRPAARPDTSRLEELTDPESAALFSSCGYSYEKVAAWVQEDGDFLTQIRNRASSYMKNPADEYEIFEMQRLFPSKGAHTTREWIRLWLEWVLWLLKSEENPLSLNTRTRMQIALVSALDMLEKNVDLCLMLDNFYNEMRKAVLENEPS